MKPKKPFVENTVSTQSAFTNHQLPNVTQSEKTKDHSTMPDIDTRSTDTPPPTAAAARAFGAIMPRPGQPGAMQFDGKNITELLEEWDIECEDFGLWRLSAALAFPIIALPISKIPSDFSPETLPPTGCVFNLTSSSFTDLKIKLATRWQLFGKALGLIGLWNVRW